ncbi:MAG: hypothetical protein JXA21_18825 [Anaerolineae bacterium]|nr:hypothetical protein [Anaerolineae bacterium]
MKKLPSNIMIGLLLIIGGVIFLLNNLNVGIAAIIWPFLFGLASLPFLLIFATDRKSWWAVLPGSALLGIAAVMFYELFPYHLFGDIGGMLFLGSLGIGFLAVYVRTGLREWWALIPGGVLLTLAAVTGLETLLGSAISGSVFMLGLGLTFGAVYLAPAPAGRNRWAAIPAGILALIGLTSLLSNTRMLGILGAIALIGLGGYLLLRNASNRRE